MQHRVPILLAALFLILLPTACASPEGPESTVRRFDGYVRDGKWDEAFALVDFEAKAVRMLGDLYSSASEQDRQATRDLWARRLKLATENYYRNHFRDGAGELVVSSNAAGKAEVLQNEAGFVLVYELEERNGNWIIVDRTHEKDGIRPRVEQGMSVVLGRIGKELGRKPTLADVNARLEHYLERTRERVLRVGAPVAPEPGAGTADPKAVESRVGQPAPEKKPTTEGSK
jgi:hypothetical protein